jgi:ribonuclease BN (tRNA processing enzyme)
MKVTFWGTGGSVPISNPKRVVFGGNTTCVRIESKCLPKDMALVVDAGTGFVPLSSALLKEGVRDLNIIFTHYHHDHTQGLLLGGTTFVPFVKNTLWGPVERGVGTKQVFESLMQPPYFPISFSHRAVGSHFGFKDFSDPNSEALVVHPIGGMKRVKAAALEKVEKNGQMIAFGDEKFGVAECLIIRMIKSNHPEFTISYRFEERPTGKVFVFLTDHENTDGLPTSLRGHLKEADLLVMDCQYKRAIYDERTAGFGHGTADYCVRVALAVCAGKLGLVHHDPSSTDDDILAVLKEGEDALVLAASGGAPGATASKGGNSNIVAIKDYDSFDLV